MFTSQHKKSHNQLLVVKYRCFLVLRKPLLVRFVCRAFFKLLYYVIWWLHPWVRKTKKPRNRCEDQKTYASPPPPLPKILSSLILNLVLSRTVRKCFKKCLEPGTLSEQQQKKEKDSVCSNRLYFFHLFVLLFSTRQASNRL